MIVDEEQKIITHVAHIFKIGDIEDPDLWAGESLYNWEKSPAGTWAMENSDPTPSWHRVPNGYGWRYEIRIYLTPKNFTYYRLKFE